jgi:uncharacterized protein (TIGR01777 family)
MTVAVTGASGFLGSRLTTLLQDRGHAIRPISLRSAPRPEDLGECDAVVHLAGEPVAQRWTAAARRRILGSRVEGTRALVAAMRHHPPNVLVSASAVGYYGSRGDEILSERALPGNDFLSQVAIAWEQEALEAEKFGVRVIRLRIGLVLGADGGALARMVKPFRLCLGGKIGGGQQWMSWIHQDDLCDLILFALRESTLRGALNATSPHPVPNAEFTRALARALHRPAILPLPALALKVILGEMSQVLLASQRAIPEAALHAGFEFQYPDVAAALVQVFSGAP